MQILLPQFQTCLKKIQICANPIVAAVEGGGIKVMMPLKSGISGSIKSLNLPSNFVENVLLNKNIYDKYISKPPTYTFRYLTTPVSLSLVTIFQIVEFRGRQCN